MLPYTYCRVKFLQLAKKKKIYDKIHSVTYDDPKQDIRASLKDQMHHMHILSNSPSKFLDF
jgi:hypothetical protein